MSSPPRVIVLTGSDIPAGTVIRYLLNTTSLKIQKVYHDQGAGTDAKLPRDRGQRRRRWFNDRPTFRCHLGLAAAMPRVYGTAVLQKLFGLTELDLLYRCERRSQRLLQHLCGFELPKAPSDRPLLQRLAEVTREYAIPMVLTPNANDAATITALRSDAPDIILGLGTRILSRDLLSIVRVGVLNAHSSLLPDYRGGVTEFWQLAGGETETGVTIHWMAADVDAGPICAQRRWPIPKRTNHHRLRLMSLFYRLELWREVIERLLSGDIPSSPQPSSHTPTFRRPTLEQEYVFYCRGIRPKWPDLSGAIMPSNGPIPTNG